MEQVADENPSASPQPDNVNMEPVDYDRDTGNDDDLDDEEQPPAGNPKPKAMPHPKVHLIHDDQHAHHEPRKPYEESKAGQQGGE